MSHRTRRAAALLFVAACALSLSAGGQEKMGADAKKAGEPPAPAAKEPRLKPGTFPTAPGTYLSGELVVIDPINRRGGLRIDGDAGGQVARRVGDDGHLRGHGGTLAAQGGNDRRASGCWDDIAHLDARGTDPRGCLVDRLGRARHG